MLRGTLYKRDCFNPNNPVSVYVLLKGKSSYMFMLSKRVLFYF